ncbi:hypothetical protein [Ferrimonas sp. YFM]|uniref:hypothetical protein n=1 Tax=Ferrimonas sp. YFM TaxID=3028878 RepID=UPI00257299FD|nr:hypothetical protein [Ferrimonas sp. YFM]BDY04159.1 hypothetical protein F0521_12000 [Ferrimonas sp. YFM]
MTLRVFSVLLLTLALQACGGGSSGNSDNDKASTKEAHFIQPDKVAAYVANFQSQYDQIKLTLDGKEYPVEFYDMSQKEKLIVVKFAEGVLTFGFDFDKETPIATSFKIDRVGDELSHKAITVTSEGDNFKMEGSVEEPVTQGLYNVEFVFNEALLSAGNASFRLDEAKTTAFVNGALGTSSYIKLKALLENNPGLKTLVLENVEGSVNDAINLHTSRLVRNAQLTTEIRKGGEAHSGGVDLFSAGYHRVYQDGATLGVHSWCCTDKGQDAGKLSKDDAQHAPYLTFSREMLGDTLGPDFYFFTIQAAPASGIHKMTRAEIDKYLLADQPR